jgi:phosphoglycolate phosphatase
MLGMGTQRDAVVFIDLDGCLVDSSSAIPNAMNAALVDIGLATVPVGVILPLIGPPLQVFAVQLVQRAGGSREQAEPFARAYLGRYEERMAEDSTVYDGIPEALTKLAERSRLVVVTLKRHELAERLLAELGLAKHLDFVVGADGTEAGKAPVLAQAIDRARPSRAVMVGDQPDDMAAARHAQIPGLGVSWGFGATNELVAAGATAIVDTPAELAAKIADMWGRRR